MAIKRSKGRGQPRRKRTNAQPQRRSITGRLTLNARGFGFVVPETGGDDVFVPPNALASAMQGDRVTVEVRRSAKGLDGRVVEILERAVRFVGGQLYVMASGAWIEPDDDRIRCAITVTGGLDRKARTGMGAIARVTTYPDAVRNVMQVEIVETFDSADLAKFEIRRILLREVVEETFPEDVLQAAKALPKSVPREDKRDREDLRDLALVTIDPADARDHDDAVWAERTKTGFRVIVAIADVSHYVKEGSVFDREALARGCTIYLPTHAIPMLPPELSSSLASLVPNKDRLALAVEVQLTKNGTIKDYRFIEALINSPARLTYEGVARELKLTKNGPVEPAAKEHRALLLTLQELTTRLNERRRERGSLGFDVPEAKVIVDPETDEPKSVERARRDPGVAQAYNMIEELALLANEVVATDLTARGVPVIYRVHGTPDPERVEIFAGLAASLGFPLTAEAAQDPKSLSRFLLKVKDTPHARTLGYLLLRSMQQATYDTTNIGHFGLAAKDYVHFTSPIRRYPDLAVHRIVRRVARGERIDNRQAERLDFEATESSRLERRAVGIEREVVDLYRAMLMRERVGETFESTIVGVTERGLFVSIEEPFVDVLCRFPNTPGARYEVDPHGVSMTEARSGRRYAMGDPLKVRITDVSVVQRRIAGSPVDWDTAPTVEPGQGRTSKRRRHADGGDKGRRGGPRGGKQGGKQGRKQGRKQTRKRR